MNKCAQLAKTLSVGMSFKLVVTLANGSKKEIICLVTERLADRTRGEVLGPAFLVNAKIVMSAERIIEGINEFPPLLKEGSSEEANSNNVFYKLCCRVSSSEIIGKGKVVTPTVANPVRNAPGGGGGGGGIVVTAAVRPRPISPIPGKASDIVVKTNQEEAAADELAMKKRREEEQQAKEKGKKKPKHIQQQTDHFLAVRSSLQHKISTMRKISALVYLKNQSHAQHQQGGVGGGESSNYYCGTASASNTPYPMSAPYNAPPEGGPTGQHQPKEEGTGGTGSNNSSRLYLSNQSNAEQGANKKDSSSSNKRPSTFFADVCKSTIIPPSIEEYSKRYVKLAKIGEGTFGEVHLMRDVVRDEAVVLKKAFTSFNDHKGLENPIVRETLVLSCMEHPNILHKLDSFIQADGTCSIVFPVISHDLSGLLRSTHAQLHWKIPQIKCVFIQILKALAYMHSKGIVHRDLKPSNVLVHRSGMVMLCDFGWSKFIETPDFSMDGLLTGPPCPVFYRPPECLAGRKHNYNALAVDMWCCGVMLFECVTNKQLVSHKVAQSGNELGVLANILETLGDPPKGSSLDRELSKHGNPIPTSNRRSHLKERLRLTLRDEQLEDLLSQLLSLEISKRIKAKDALRHPWFTAQSPIPCQPANLPLPVENTYRYQQKILQKERD